MFGKRRKPILEAFTKATRVIASCKTITHLNGAREYANNFLVLYSKDTEEYIAKRPILEVDPFTETCYKRLLGQIERKLQEINE